MNDSKLKTSSLCKTEEVMKKVLPETFKIDSKAIALVDKCLREFATTVAAVGAGFSSIDTTQKPLSTTRELKPDHIIQSLDSMGYTDYTKALSKYHHGLKLSSNMNRSTSQSYKPSIPLNRSVPSSATSSKTGSNASAATATQKKTISNVKPVPVVVTNVNHKSIVKAKKSQPHISSTSTITAKPIASISATAATPAYSINSKTALGSLDRDLLFQKPAMSEEAHAQKHGVTCEFIRQRIAHLKSSKYVTNGVVGKGDGVKVKPSQPSLSTAGTVGVSSQADKHTQNINNNNNNNNNNSRSSNSNDIAFTSNATGSSTNNSVFRSPLSTTADSGSMQNPSAFVTAAYSLPMTTAVPHYVPASSRYPVLREAAVSAAAGVVATAGQPAGHPILQMYTAGYVPPGFSFQSHMPPPMTASTAPMPPQMSTSAAPIPPHMSSSTAPMSPQMTASTAPMPLQMSISTTSMPPQMPVVAAPVHSSTSAPITATTGVKRTADAAGLETPQSSNISATADSTEVNHPKVP